MIQLSNVPGRIVRVARPLLFLIASLVLLHTARPAWAQTDWNLVDNKFSLSYLYYRILTSEGDRFAEWKGAIDAFRLDPTNRAKRSALPGFQEIVDSLNESKVKFLGSTPQRVVALGSMGGSLGGITTRGISPQGEIIDQLGAFLIERVQEEATLALLDQLREWISERSDDNVLPKLLPNTYKLIENTRYTTFQTLGTMWQSSFRQDLGMLVPTIARDSVLRLQLIREGIRLADPRASDAGWLAMESARIQLAVNSAVPYVRLTLDAIGEIEKGRNALEVVSDLPIASLGLPDDLLPPLQLVQELADEIYEQESAYDQDRSGSISLNSVYLLTVHRFVTAPREQQLLFIELLAADNLPNDFTGEKLKSVVDRYLPKIREALTVLENLRRFVHDFETTESLDEKGDMFQNYVQATNDLLSIARLFPVGDESRIDSLLAMGQYVVNLQKALANNSYGEAMTDVMLLYQTLTTKPLPERVYRLVAVAANVASAKSGDEIIEAFRAAASPVGSYRTKRTAGKSFALNAYVGGTIGPEILFGGDTAVDLQTGLHLGLWAPMGVEYAWGFGSSSVSVFMSLVDLGAVLNYRIVSPDEGTTDVDRFPQVGFAQIFSPGIHVIWGLSGKAPVTLSLGAEMTPRLRNITKEDGTPLFGAHSIRVMGSAAIDLTLMLF